MCSFEPSSSVLEGFLLPGEGILFLNIPLLLFLVARKEIIERKEGVEGFVEIHGTDLSPLPKREGVP